MLPFVAEKEGKHYLIKDGREVSELPFWGNVNLSFSLKFSEDGKRWAYIVQSVSGPFGGIQSTFAVVDGKGTPENEFYSIAHNEIVFSRMANM